MNPTTCLDFYKTDHKSQYPNGTSLVYSNFTPRSDGYAPVHKDYWDGKLVWFGLQGFVIDYLMYEWDQFFFGVSKEVAVAVYKRRMDNALGEGAVDTKELEALHDLGYLPLKIKALPEGTKVPMKVPVLTVYNTLPEFFWLTNYIETVASCELWKPTTTATIAHQYRKILEHWAEVTGSPKEVVDIQAHDFSMRGMSGRKDAAMSGMGHLLSFVGTDTVPAIDAAEALYNANSDTELVGCSVPACYDSETEVLTEKGFLKFSEVNGEVKVAQYHENGYIDFVRPTAHYNMPYEGKMVRWYNTGVNNIDLLVTPNHKMVRWNVNTGSVQLFEAGDTSYKFRKGYSQRNHMLVSGITSSTDPREGLSSLERLKVAFQADGSYPSSDKHISGQIRFSLKKERKIQRLKQILSEVGFKHTVSEKDARGYVNFWVNPLEPMFEKDFSWVGFDKSCAWYRDFLLELQYWDGCKKNNTIVYSSTNKDCIDQVQSFSALCGYKSKINSYQDSREDYNRKTMHTITLTLNSKVGGKPIERVFVDYSGTVHCVSVPTKMLIVRRNNKVSVCGNTEHSVMCMGGNEDEVETFRRLIEDVYPTGIVSIVSDTWDFWKVITDYSVQLKDKIMARQPNALGLNKVVFRPDSGCPVKILCGDPEGATEAERKGAVECLWDIFGGTETDKGYKMLDEHVGLIYGDSITLERAATILERLAAKGFASTNVVFGVGSYTYQMITRDSFGMAMKATYGEVNGEGRELYKDPATDSGVKKSAKGLLRVEREDGQYVLYDQQTWEQEAQGELRTVFEDGELLINDTFEAIRQRLREEV